MKVLLLLLFFPLVPVHAEVCTAAYAPYRQGTIYPQMVVGCDERLNRVLLEELKGLGE